MGVGLEPRQPWVQGVPRGHNTCSQSWRWCWTCGYDEHRNKICEKRKHEHSQVSDWDRH